LRILLLFGAINNIYGIVMTFGYNFWSYMIIFLRKKIRCIKDTIEDIIMNKIGNGKAIIIVGARHSIYTSVFHYEFHFFLLLYCHNKNTFFIQNFWFDVKPTNIKLTEIHSLLFVYYATNPNTEQIRSILGENKIRDKQVSIRLSQNMV